MQAGGSSLWCGCTLFGGEGNTDQFHVVADKDRFFSEGRMGPNHFTAHPRAGRFEDFGTARVRLGYAWGRFLPYLTAGFTYATTETYYNPSYGLAMAR